MAEISSLSNETVWQKIKYINPRTGAVIPTIYAVDLAFTLEGNPVTWYPAVWEVGADTSGWYYAKAEIGPGGVVALTAGLWRIWARLTLPTETPIYAGEYLVVY